MALIQTRRSFLGGIAAAGAASLLGAPRASAAGALETTAVRLGKFPSACLAPQYAAEELLRAEGFTDISYVDMPGDTDISGWIGQGKVDFSQDFAARLVNNIDAGLPLTVISGVHAGCYELLGSGSIQTVADLKGKSIGVDFGGGKPHAFLAAMVAGLGFDPSRDIRWVLDPSPSALELFAEGKVDAYLGFPPMPQAARARGIGRVIVNAAVDRPWSQYYCCMLAGHRDYVQKHPVATKRVRAFLEAADLCVTDPAAAARRVVDIGITDRYDYALQAMREIPYDKWREYDPEDTLRFVSLRLHEAGMIKSTPQRIIAESADWRFLNELKRELKA